MASSALYAKDNVCRVDRDIIYSILMSESVSRDKIGYEYLISFNDKRDSKSS